MKPTPTVPPKPRSGRRLALALASANSQGLTLIECLVAIIMVALVASAITPALILSVATRVQSQKAEQAMALGQAEIDRVRQLVEQGVDPNPGSPPTRGLQAVAAQVPLAPATVLDSAPETQVGAAVGVANIFTEEEVREGQFTANSPTRTRVVCFSDDNPTDPANKCDDGRTPAFAVQVYRTQGIEDTNDLPVAFALGVRVYDYDAVASGTGGNLSTDPLSLGITGGTGQRSQRPIVALYTTIAVAERNDSLCDLIRYSQSTTGVVASAPLGCGP